MGELEPSSISALVTDPPYGIRFMGKAWDGTDIERNIERDARRRGKGPPKMLLTGSADSPNRKLIPRTGSGFINRACEAGSYDFSLKGNRAFQEWCRSWGELALHALKPGAHALVFGGARTYHRMAAGLEDAGFEIRDCLAWLYGSGFPKSHDLGNGWGTALKPAFEPIVVARKPPSEPNIAANVARWGTGGLNVNETRIGTSEEVPSSPRRARQGAVYGDLGNARGDESGFDPNIGRWPANVALDEEAASILDRQSGRSTSRVGKPRAGPHGAGWGMTATGTEHDDTGGASRFFYVAKASRAEREAGLHDLGARFAPTMGDGIGGREHSPDEPAAYVRNIHPTVKPVALMRHLVRLVTPPGGLVLDPFLGSGTTGIAATLEGFDFLGIEREAEYVPIIERRLAWWAEHGEHSVERARVHELERDTGQMTLDAA